RYPHGPDELAVGSQQLDRLRLDTNQRQQQRYLWRAAECRRWNDAQCVDVGWRHDRRFSKHRRGDFDVGRHCQRWFGTHQREPGDQWWTCVGWLGFDFRVGCHVGWPHVRRVGCDRYITADGWRCRDGRLVSNWQPAAIDVRRRQHRWHGYHFRNAVDVGWRGDVWICFDPQHPCGRWWRGAGWCIRYRGGAAADVRRDRDGWVGSAASPNHLDAGRGIHRRRVDRHDR